MKDHFEYFCERIEADNECIRRLMMIISNSLPHTQNAMHDLNREWNRVKQEIDNEYLKDKQ